MALATRRTFLQGAASVVAVAGTPALATGEDWKPGKLLALYDAHAEPGAAFSEQARAQGAQVHALPRDPASAWFSLVADRADDLPDAVIGLTSLGSLFCLERLGWDLGFRVRARIEHVAAQDSSWEHLPHSPLPAWALAGLMRAGPQFGAASARALLDSRPAGHDCTHAAPHRAAASERTLVSWLLAPRPRA